MISTIPLFFSLVFLTLLPMICNELRLRAGIQVFLIASIFFITIVLLYFSLRLGTDFDSYVSVINILRSDDPAMLSAGWALHEVIFWGLIQIYSYFILDEEMVVKLLSITTLFLVLLAYLFNRQPNSRFFFISIFCSFYAVSASINAVRLGLAIALTLSIIQLFPSKARFLTLILPLAHTSLMVITLIAYPAIIFIIGIIFFTTGSSIDSLIYVEEKIKSYSDSTLVSFFAIALLFVGNLCLIWSLKKWYSRTVFIAAIGISSFAFIYSFYSYLGIRIQGLLPIMICFWAAISNFTDAIFLRIMRHPGFRLAIIIYAVISIRSLVVQMFYQEM